MESVGGSEAAGGAVCGDLFKDVRDGSGCGFGGVVVPAHDS